ncbi:hypothetical protein BXZ70DRAFT_875874, partial [Cristinia sonorae]
MFQAIRTVFSKNPDVTESDIPRIQKARKLIVKVVNALTSRSEIGAPMACLYLLNHNDHYKSHKFSLCYWRMYLRKVMKAFPEENTDEGELEEKVVIQKQSSTSLHTSTPYVGISSVMDYIHRPISMENTSLYDWIRRAEKKTTKQIKSAKQLSQIDSIRNHRWVGRRVEFLVKCDELIEYEDNHKDEIDQANLETEHQTDWVSFDQQHPQYNTHMVRLVSGKNSLIPNFVGGSLPRRDAGSREEYCTVMLMLFKPWRNGNILKGNASTWHSCFTDHIFTKRQHELMKFFNIRYECNDARDDYNAQRKAGKKDDKISALFGDQNDFDKYYLDDNMTIDEIEQHMKQSEQDIDVSVPSEEYLRKMLKMQSMLKILKRTGVLDPVNQTQLNDMNSVTVSQYSGSIWKSKLMDLKDTILQRRTKQCKTDDKSNETNTKIFEVNSVKIVNKSYLTATFKPNNPLDVSMMSNIVQSFTLNEEQERAFRIIANHVVQDSGEQLRMYLGGMAGTGKSQVIKSLIELFRQRNEEYRFQCIAPTGAAAALIGGST